MLATRAFVPGSAVPDPHAAPTLGSVDGRLRASLGAVVQRPACPSRPLQTSLWETMSRCGGARTSTPPTPSGTAPREGSGLRGGRALGRLRSFPHCSHLFQAAHREQVCSGGEQGARGFLQRSRLPWARRQTCSEGLSPQTLPCRAAAPGLEGLVPREPESRSGGEAGSRPAPPWAAEVIQVRGRGPFRNVS